MDRKEFLALMSTFPAMGCTRAAKLPDPEPTQFLLTHEELGQLMDIFDGIWWKEQSPRESLTIRVRLWNKLLAFTDPITADYFKDAYLDNFLDSLPSVLYKYFIDNGGDQKPEDMDELKAAVKRSIK